MINYVETSYKFFGSISKTVKPYFLDIKSDLQRANMGYTLEEYLSTALFTTTITFFIECLLLAFIFGLLMDPIISVFLAMTLSLTISGLLFFLFYTYPAATARNREGKIKKVLPFSVSYMATMASARLSPIILFKTIAKFKEYGEISEEANRITRDVELFGMALLSALKRQAKRTPSKDMRELLWGINSVIASGSDLMLYLKGKCDEFMNDYRRRIRKYSQDLSLIIEIYLTLIITGSIFFIVLSSIISAITPGLEAVWIQSFIVFILLPIVSIAFIILIKSTSPTE
jgi:flagellar protein FlaJ